MADRRGSRQERGYGKAHTDLRARIAREVAEHGYRCWRCQTAFPPGAAFDLGHDDEDRKRYRGPECPPCNRATAGRRSTKRPSPRHPGIA